VFKQFAEANFSLHLIFFMIFFVENAHAQEDVVDRLLGKVVVGVDKTKNYVQDKYLIMNGEWRDPKTDLIWSRCMLGQRWSETKCLGEPKFYEWRAAMKTARMSNYGGHTGWRLPNSKELGTIKYENGKYVSDLLMISEKLKETPFEFFWSSDAAAPGEEAWTMPVNDANANFSLLPIDVGGRAILVRFK
jgi:hypothetical protein